MPLALINGRLLDENGNATICNLVLSGSKIVGIGYIPDDHNLEIKNIDGYQIVMINFTPDLVEMAISDALIKILLSPRKYIDLKKKPLLLSKPSFVLVEYSYFQSFLEKNIHAIEKKSILGVCLLGNIVWI